jgi:hypothetical protein
MYRRGDGSAALVESKEHFDQFKDKHLWQETPWRMTKVRFCAECEKLGELVKSLESELATLAEDHITDLDEKDKLIETLRDALKAKKVYVK